MHFPKGKNSISTRKISNCQKSPVRKTFPSAEILNRKMYHVIDLVPRIVVADGYLYFSLVLMLPERE
jgi:hypothetical protein